jgi:GNAT superfamily N-acetyltransferase
MVGRWVGTGRCAGGEVASVHARVIEASSFEMVAPEGPTADTSNRSEGDLRLATPDDVPAIDGLMKASTRDLFPAFYTERQTASSIEHIAHIDTMLVEDGTYFVVDVAGEIVACGGWSRRDKLFSGTTEQEGRSRILDPASEPARVRAMFVRSDWTRRGLGTRILEACEAAAKAEGFRRLTLWATLPGFMLYERYGFEALRRDSITLPDGVTIECVEMEKPID